MQPISKPILLSSESAEEYASLRAEMEKEIKPQGVLEQIFVDDVAAITWDILRHRRNKTGIIRNTFPGAIHSILRQLLHRQNYLDNISIFDPIIDMTALDFFCKKQPTRKS